MTRQRDPVDTFLALATGVSRDLSGLWVFYHASSDKLAAMEKSNSWVARGYEELDAKEFGKLRGAALFSYRDYLLKVSIGALATAIETACISAKELTAKKVNLWGGECGALPYVLDVRKVTALHNVLKHNKGVVRRTTSTSSKYLVDSCGIPDGQQVVYLKMDVPEQLCRAYVFLLHLAASRTGVRPPAMRGSERKLRSAFLGGLPHFLKKRRGRRTTA